MRSPFDDLGKPRVAAPRGEEVEGAFTCQEDGCNIVMNTARYLSEVHIVTWQCVNGHISKVSMNLD